MGQHIPEGRMVIMTSGEYSDYRIMGLFKVVKRIEIQDAIDGWVKQYPGQAEFMCEDALLAKLVREKYLVEVEATEWCVEGSITRGVKFDPEYSGTLPKSEYCPDGRKHRWWNGKDYVEVCQYCGYGDQ